MILLGFTITLSLKLTEEGWVGIPKLQEGDQQAHPSSGIVAENKNGIFQETPEKAGTFLLF